MRFVSISLFLLIALGSPLAAQVDSVPAPAEGQASPAIAEPQPRIELTSPDKDISRRLRGLFGQIGGLDQVQVTVRNGVVTLNGTALTSEARQKAEAIAERLAGVVSVQNDIEIEHRLGRRIRPVIESSDQLAGRIIAFLPLLALSLVVFVAIWGLGRVLTRSSGLLRRIAPNPLVQTLIAQVIRLAFILLGLIVAMRILGATALLGSVLGAAGVLGIAIGFAVRDTIENYIASILLSIRRPFAPKDHVIIEGMEGRVTRLNSRATFLTSFDGNELRIPNAIVYKAKITNFSQIPQRRFEFTVGIGYENDLCRSLSTALAAVKSASGVLPDPEPSVLIDTLDASTISLKIFGWVDQRKSEFAKVRSEAIRAVKAAFDDNSISMPAPIQNIRAIGEPTAHEQPARRTSRAETEQVSDTRADRTIERKVESVRSGAEEDLLTEDAPRE